MKIQKLVYMMHGWHLAILDEPAIDGSFEAWPYGPVEDELYHVFKQYRSNPIKTYANSWVGGESKSFVVSKSKVDFHDIFNRVFDKYMPLSATQLSSLTHQPGTPWSQVRANQGSMIPNDMIRDHFRTQVVSNG
ncbi:MAG: type II toxin-antitoxin system antitoxin SocA domain-containing protein [Litorimonas sp.]